MSDFVQSSWNDFLNEKFSWELVMTQFFSVRNMDDKELQEAILSDLLGVTFWEKEKKTKVSFTKDDLIRFIYGQQRRRITEMLNHENISNLISVENDQIRIRDQYEILQAAMEFAGVWFGDHEPEDPGIPARRMDSGSVVVQIVLSVTALFQNNIFIIKNNQRKENVANQSSC